MCDSSCKEKEAKKLLFSGENGGSSSAFDINPFDTKIYMVSLCYKG